VRGDALYGGEEGDALCEGGCTVWGG
jgi:hypothetical protein